MNGLPCHASQSVLIHCVALVVDASINSPRRNIPANAVTGCCDVPPQSRCNFPEKWETHMRASGKTLKELKAKELKPYKHIDPWCEGVIHTLSSNDNDVVRSHRPLVINILAKDYKNINLAAMMLEIADEVGLDPECLEEDSEEEDSDDSTEDSAMSE